MTTAKSACYSKIIAEHSGDHESFWKAFNNTLDHGSKMQLPDHFSIDTFPYIYISSIHSPLPSGSCPSATNPPDSRTELSNFTSVTVCCLVLMALCSSSYLNPTPARLGINCIDILATQITSIVNLSFSKGSCLSHFKTVCFLSDERSLYFDKDYMRKYLVKSFESCGMQN